MLSFRLYTQLDGHAPAQVLQLCWIKLSAVCHAKPAGAAASVKACSPSLLLLVAVPLIGRRWEALHIPGWVLEVERSEW